MEPLIQSRMLSGSDPAHTDAQRMPALNQPHRPRGGGHAFPGWGTAIETQLATIPTLTRLSTPRGRWCALAREV